MSPYKSLRSTNTLFRNGKWNIKKARNRRKEVDKQGIKQRSSCEVIKSLQHKYSIKLLCQKVNISRSSYYKWLHRSPTTRDIANSVLKNDIANIYKKYDDIYGYRHIYIYIRLRMKMLVNHKRVYRLMKSLGLKSMIR
ncbi:transposase [Staphylococcus gallinarum]|nr:transposase [Staphylococcus gallinarum]